MGFNVAFALVPGPDRRQWVAWQVTDGNITVTFPGINPDEVEEFADALRTGFQDAGKEAAKANSGLLIPGFNMDPQTIQNMQQWPATAGAPHNGSGPPPGHPG